MDDLNENQVGELYVVGTRGYSAYEVAVQNGFEGTVDEWLESLIGPQGPEGPEGPQGETGPIGHTPNIRVGSVTTGEAGTDVIITKTGSLDIPIFNFTIPKGDKGDQGTTQYSDLNGKPTLNGITLEGAVTLNDIGAQPAGNYALITDIPDMTPYVKNTDYATFNKAGVFKISDANAIGIDANGNLMTPPQTYQQYQSLSNYGFIGKGTLENVITGKDLTTKAYVDGLVGDINTILDSINGEVI